MGPTKLSHESLVSRFNFEDYCYDGLFVTYLPFPLVNYGNDIHIAPEAYDVASAEFGPDALAVWEAAAKIKLAKVFDYFTTF